MPWKRIAKGRNRGKYRGKKGRIWTRKQIALYYATDGFTKKPRRKRR